MRGTRYLTIPAVVAVACALLLAASVPASALSLWESRPGVWGKIVDEEGNPVPGIKVWLKPATGSGATLTAKTNRKGVFAFPRVEFFKDGYRIGIDSDVWFIRNFHMRTRRLSQEIWQDDSYEGLWPGQQDRMPVLQYRGGNATIEFTVARIEDYQQKMAEMQRAKASGAQAQETGKRRREMTPEDLGDEAMALGDYATAATKYAEALEQKPDDADLLWKHIQALARSGDTGAALRECRRLLQIDPERKGVRLWMARWMQESGQLQFAIPYLEKERELAPTDARVHKMLIEAYREAGQEEKVEEAVEKWLAAIPDDTEAMLEMAQIKARKGDAAGAEELFKKVAEKDPDNADKLYYNVGATIMNRPNLTKDDRERAVVAFEKALEINPDYAKAHLQLGYALLGLGKLKEAREHFERFLALAPDSPEAKDARDLVNSLPK